MHYTTTFVAAFAALSVQAAAQASYGAPSSSVAAPPTYTPPTYTPSCEEQENSCRTAPDANQAYCSSQRCSCDGKPDYCHPSSSSVPSYPAPTSSAPPTYTPPTYQPSCEEQENACRTAPDANQAYCSSQRCACDGGKPYCTPSSSVPPYPSSTPKTCDEQENECRTGPDANQAYCSSQRCSCDGKPDYCHPSSSIPPYPTSTPASSVPPYPSSTPKTCDEQENECRTGPDANQAFCSAQRCSCDGAKPYCKTGSNSTTPAVPTSTPSTPAQTCDEQENACRTGPDANQAFCSSQRCSCDGAPAYCKTGSPAPSGSLPSGPKPNSSGPSPPLYTGAASTLEVPVFAAIAGLAAYFV